MSAAAALDRLETQLAHRQAEQQTLRQARSDYAARMTEAQHQAQAEPEAHHNEPDLET